MTAPRGRLRRIALVSATLVSSALAIGGSVLAVHLVWLGAYPSEGEGSLGHVGIVIAGLVCGFLAMVFALLALYTGLRVRKDRRETPF